MGTITLRDWRDPNEPPSTGRAVIVLIRYGYGQYRRIRGMYFHEDDPETHAPWDDPETQYALSAQGWYEATVIDPTLWPVEDSDVIAWTPLPDLPPDVGNP